jgi:hypothetical protein
MTANITIVTGQRAALFIPAAAVGHEGGRSVVYLAQRRADDQPVERTVRTGVRQGALLEVTDGLGPVERILAAPPADRGGSP